MTFACEAPVRYTGENGVIKQDNQLFAQGRTLPFFRGHPLLRS